MIDKNDFGMAFTGKHYATKDIIECLEKLEDDYTNCWLQSTMKDIEETDNITLDDIKSFYLSRDFIKDMINYFRAKIEVEQNQNA